MSISRGLIRESVLGFPIAATPFSEQVDLIMQWEQQRLSRVVCVANCYQPMEAWWSDAFGKASHYTDWHTPDGMPLVWILNLLRKTTHDRVAGRLRCPLSYRQSGFFMRLHRCIKRMMGSI